jgi:hypothetical protein
VITMPENAPDPETSIPRALALIEALHRGDAQGMAVLTDPGPMRPLALQLAGIALRLIKDIAARDGEDPETVLRRLRGSTSQEGNEGP